MIQNKLQQLFKRFSFNFFSNTFIDHCFRRNLMNRTITVNHTFGFIFSFTFSFTGEDSRVDLLC